jgi:large subunit ribosomal protein L23
MALFKKKTEKEVPKEVKAEPKKETGKQAAWVYNIIKAPHITEKATGLAEKGKYVFNVASSANKQEIKKAIKAMYDVKVKNVNLIHTPSKKRRMGRSEGYHHGLEKGFKKAIVTVEGKIDVMPR